MNYAESTMNMDQLIQRFATKLEVAVPGRVTVEAQMVKLQDEVDEFVAEPSLEELADVVVVCGMAAFTLGYNFRDLMRAVRQKMFKNLARQWYPTASGTARHTPEEPEA